MGTCSKTVQHVILAGLQLTRSFLRMLAHASELGFDATNYLVRVKTGSLYAAAQIVQIDGDELQLRVVDEAVPEHTQKTKGAEACPSLEKTKLVSVSNIAFRKKELAEFIAKQGARGVLDMPVSQAEGMIASRSRVHAALQHAAQQHAHSHCLPLPPVQRPPEVVCKGGDIVPRTGAQSVEAEAESARQDQGAAEPPLER